MPRFLAAAILATAMQVGLTAVSPTEKAETAAVDVHAKNGIYTVTARFVVPQPPALTLAVLSDYEQIPRFMPDVRTSTVRERGAGRLLVEQEAESRFMTFSKKVHLLLEVTERGDTIRFVDRCGRSFASYEGAWRATPNDGGTVVSYELRAKPAFTVPGFILKRLLQRDSSRMIAGLRREMAARAERQ